MARIRNDELFDAQRGKILEAAAACFVERGFHGASVADICDAAGGISPGRLYHYFASKQAIVEALVSEERFALAEMFEAADRAKDPLTALLSLVRLSVKRAVDGAYAALALEIVSESARNPAVAAIVLAADRQYLDRLESLIARARQAGGGWAPREDAVLARAVTMVIDGATARSVLDVSIRPKLAREAQDMVARLLDRAGD